MVNACGCKDSSTLERLAKDKAFDALTELLDETEPKTTVLALDCIKGILMAGGRGRKFLDIFEAVGCVRKLVELQTAANPEISKRVECILESFVFGRDEAMLEGNNPNDKE